MNLQFQLNHRVANLWLVLIVSGFTALLIFSGLFVTNAQQGVPDQPDGLVGRLLWRGALQLDWNDTPGAASYEVQYWHVNLGGGGGQR